jgi:hypothetical protein
MIEIPNSPGGVFKSQIATIRPLAVGTPIAKLKFSSSQCFCLNLLDYFVVVYDSTGDQPQNQLASTKLTPLPTAQAPMHQFRSGVVI